MVLAPGPVRCRKKLPESVQGVRFALSRRHGSRLGRLPARHCAAGTDWDYRSVGTERVRGELAGTAASNPERFIQRCLGDIRVVHRFRCRQARRPNLSFPPQTHREHFRLDDSLVYAALDIRTPHHSSR